MSILKPALVLVILSSILLCNYAWATEPPPRVGAVKGETKQATPPKKQAVKRRAVRQLPNGMPPPPAPTAAYRSHNAPPPLVPPQTLPIPSSQIGPDYKGGVGTTLLSPDGKLCNNNGMTVQCF
jgi:hypothetical protein